MKKLGALVSSILMVCLGLSGCGGGSSKSKSQGSGRTLVSITVTAASSATSVATGATLQFSAQGKFSDGSVSDVSSQVAWKSSDTTMGIMNSAGVLTGVKTGSITVTATEGTIRGSMAITVTQASLVSIAITGNGSLAAGASEPLYAQGTYTDGSTQLITSQVAWKSLDTSIATISSSGTTWNTVQRQRFPVDEVDEVLEEVRMTLRARGRTRTQWEVGSSAPEGLVEALLEHGVVPDKDPYAVALVLTNEPPPIDPMFTARRIETLKELEAACEVQWEAFGSRPEEIEEARGLLPERFADGHEPPARRLARRGDRLYRHGRADRARAAPLRRRDG